MSTIKLRGSRVLLNCPPRKDLGLHLSEEAQKELLIKQLDDDVNLIFSLLSFLIDSNVVTIKYLFLKCVL